MIRHLVWALFFFFLFSTTAAITADTRPTADHTASTDQQTGIHLLKTPISDEQLEIYRTFLGSYSNGTPSDHLNLANRTSPLEIKSEKTGGECLDGIEIESLKAAESSSHLLDAKIVLPENVTLVDPDKQRLLIDENDPQRAIFTRGKSLDASLDISFATGLMTLSEVAFDKNHKYAVMSYSFVCGELCGHGEIIVFGKGDGKWVPTKRKCGSWIS